MNNYKYLDVFYEGKKVGILAKTNQYVTAFEYAGEWLEEGFSISPFSLPLEKKWFKKASHDFC